MEQQTGSKFRKEHVKVLYCHPAYLIYMQSTSVLNGAQAGIKTARRSINKLWYKIYTTLVAKTPILWPPDAKSWLIWKDPDAGKDWGQEEKGRTEDEMVGWNHRFHEHGFGWTPGVGDGPGGLACCDSWGRKESDTTERMNWAELWRKGKRN